VRPPLPGFVGINSSTTKILTLQAYVAPFYLKLGLLTSNQRHIGFYVNWLRYRSALQSGQEMPAKTVMINQGTSTVHRLCLPTYFHSL